MTVAALEVAESFGLSETELIHQALVSFLQEQRRQVLSERFEILRAIVSTHWWRWKPDSARRCRRAPWLGRPDHG